jgi:2-methylcitrate dehydratase PrpD
VPATSTLAAELGDFLASATLADVPEHVRDRLRDDVVDLAGCAVFGLQTPWGSAVAQHVVAQQERPDASIWGTASRASAGGAALALGTLAHSFDFDDYHAEAKLHPATVVVPAALSLGESLSSSGERVLLATALGFETMIRLALASGPVSTMLNGFHLTGICGSVGAAAAAACLLELDVRTTAHALGLAATQSAGLMGFLHDGSETKRLHAGKAAQSGILAAQLAARGLTGPARVFELEHGGFCHAFGVDPQPARLVEDLGRRWRAGDVSFKRYSCCGSIHSTLDLVTEAVRRLGVEPGQIDEIEVLHSPAVIAQCGWRYEPSDVLHAQMSIQYSVAALLLEGAVLPEQFRQSMLDDAALLALAARVRFTPDDDVAEKYPAKFASRVVVRAGGAEVDLRTDHPKGAPDNPLTREEVDEKFLRLTQDGLSKEQQQRFVQGARQLDRLENVKTLVAELRVDEGQAEL